MKRIVKLLIYGIGLGIALGVTAFLLIGLISFFMGMVG